MVEMTDHVTERTTGVSFALVEQGVCLHFFSRDERFLAPADLAEGEWTHEVDFPPGTTCRVSFINPEVIDPFIQIELSNWKGKMCLHLSTRAARDLRNALAQTLGAEETSGQETPQVRKPVALILDTVHESVRAPAGTFRLRQYQHHLSEQPDVVLVTDWQGRHDVGALVTEIQLNVGICLDRYRDDHATLIVHSPNTMVWTSNGHVRCETWDRYQVGHGICRTTMSREQVVALIGQELSDD
jgi:hypothetical protein